jgi:hypothetical protein
MENSLTRQLKVWIAGLQLYSVWDLYELKNQFSVRQNIHHCLALSNNLVKVFDPLPSLRLIVLRLHPFCLEFLCQTFC